MRWINMDINLVNSVMKMKTNGYWIRIWIRVKPNGYGWLDLNGFANKNQEILITTKNVKINLVVKNNIISNIIG